MPLAFTHSLQGDLTHFVRYSIRKYTVAGFDGDEFDPVNEEDHILQFEGGFWYEYRSDLEFGSNSFSGGFITENPSTGEYLPMAMMFLPAGGFRYPELDRAPWASAQIRKAETNIALGGMTKTTRVATWDNEPEEGPGVDTETAETTGASLSMALAGLKVDENELLKIYNLNQVGDFGSYDENTEKKFTITNFVKTYLNERNNYDAFAITVLAAGIMAEVQPTSPYDSMKKLLEATVVDTRVWTDYAGGDNNIISGSLTAKSVEWSAQVPFSGGYAFWDLSGWTMNANSRVGPGISSSRV